MGQSSQTECSKRELNEEGLIEEILVRLPAWDLYPCKSVCKHWLSLISSPYFVKYYTEFNSKNDDHKSVTTFLIVDTSDHDSDVGRFKGICLTDSDSNSVAGPRRVFDYGIQDYFPGFKERNLSHIRLRGVSDQFWLIEGTFTSPDRCEQYVVNPISKQGIKLPPINEYPTDGVTFAYDHPTVGEFTVVNVKVINMLTRTCNIQAFSSSRDDWKLFNLSRPSIYGCSKEDIYNKFIVSFWKGCFYWVGCCEVLSFDPFKRRIQFNHTKLPHRCDSSEGSIRLSATRHGKLWLYFQRDTTFLVWELILDDSDLCKNSWSLIYETQSLALSFCDLSYADGDKVYYVNSSSLFGTSHCHVGAVSLDLKNGSFSHDLDLFRQEEGGRLNKVVPFTLPRCSWPRPLPRIKVSSSQKYPMEV